MHLKGLFYVKLIYLLISLFKIFTFGYEYFRMKIMLVIQNIKFYIILTNIRLQTLYSYCN